LPVADRTHVIAISKCETLGVWYGTDQRFDRAGDFVDLARDDEDGGSDPSKLGLGDILA
jgi:hypothetical protein